MRIGGLLLGLLLMAIGRAPAAADLPAGWENLPVETALLADPGERVVQHQREVSRHPLPGGHPGRRHRELPEVLTARFDAVDCFTFLDYVEALRRSADAGEFRARLIEVRYRDGVVGWGQRRHFFTDWAAAPGGRVVDVTAEVGGAARPAGGQAAQPQGRRHPCCCRGWRSRSALIHFIPAAALDSQVLGRLRPGDYLSASTLPTRAGCHATSAWSSAATTSCALRHASSRREAGQVIDSDFLTYLAGKPGIVVLRPVEP